MKRPGFPIRLMSIVGVAALLALLAAGPVEAFPSLFETTPEPSPRPTATAAPYIELNPDQGVVGNDNQTVCTGYLFTSNAMVVFFFDGATPMTVLQGVTWNADGTFMARLQIPPQAGAGVHTVTARQASSGLEASASYTLLAPTPTDTPLPTDTTTPTNTPLPPTQTFTPTPKTPTPTLAPTLTSSPTPTLRAITPMVTISPIPPTRPAGGGTSVPVATHTPAPTRTNTPAPTRTNTPVPGTPTPTYTPSVTPTPSNTPGPGTPSATPLPTPQPTATPVEEISETGGAWGTIFLWGFVLAGLLVVFRLLRVTGLRRG